MKLKNMINIMWHKILLLLLLSISYCFGAPLIGDPLKNNLNPGSTYLEWTVDLNNDGINDILLSEKLSDGIGDNPFADLHGFGAYLGVKGGGYINIEHTDTPKGQEIGGMNIDVSQCFVGYIGELNKYGIVTIHSKWQRSKGVYDSQVVAYTVEGDRIKETYLGKEMDPEQPNASYNKYLSSAKRTKVQLKEVQIPK